MKKTLLLKRVIRMNLAVERSGTYEWGVGGCWHTG